jgi:hypothetical protein
MVGTTELDGTSVRVNYSSAVRRPAGSTRPSKHPQKHAPLCECMTMHEGPRHRGCVLLVLAAVSTIIPSTVTSRGRLSAMPR